MSNGSKSIDEVASSVLETAASTASQVLESETAAKVVDTVQNQMLPQLLAAGSFVYGVVFPEGVEKAVEAGANAIVPAQRASSGRASTGAALFYGVLLGMGLSSQLYERRILDKFRLKLYTWLFDSPEEDEEDDVEESRSAKFRTPVQLDTLEGLPMPGSEKEDVSGIFKEMVSPEWALTPNLHVALLTLPFGSELLAQPSPGVEFYCVISGEGSYIKEEEGAIITIKSGSGFLVDPGTCRGFSAKTKGGMVLLRATDAGAVEGYDIVSGQSNSSSRALLSAGIGKIEEMYKKYKAEGFEVVPTADT